jgi:diketogulonate reductase-like aldo/keto reductase
MYKNEEPSAAAIKKSSIPRSQIFFTSKIPPRTLSYENAKAQIDASLKLTGFDYIDLMLLHAPFGGRENRKGAWKALVEAQEAGKIRSIGVSNYGVHHLDELEVYIKELEKERGGAGKGGKIDVGQWEIHPWLPRKDITEWCKKRGVVVEAYCPIVRNKRANDPALQPLMKKHGKTSTQILIRWSLQKGFVPLPKSVTPSRIVENADVYDFELDEEDMKALDIDSYAPCAWDPTVSKLEE